MSAEADYLREELKALLQDQGTRVQLTHADRTPTDEGGVTPGPRTTLEALAMSETFDVLELFQSSVETGEERIFFSGLELEELNTAGGHGLDLDKKPDNSWQVRPVDPPHTPSRTISRVRREKLAGKIIYLEVWLGGARGGGAT